MSKARFRISYAIVTEDSVRNGEAAYIGFMTRNEACPRRRFNPKVQPATFRFRDAIRICQAHDSGREGIHAPDSHLSPSCPPRWLSFSDWAGYHTKEGTTELNLHLEGTVTGSTAMRIARFLGCHGVK